MFPGPVQWDRWGSVPAVFPTKPHVQSELLTGLKADSQVVTTCICLLTCCFFLLICTEHSEKRKCSWGWSFNKFTKPKGSLQIKIQFQFSEQNKKLIKQVFKLHFSHDNSVTCLEIWNLIFATSFFLLFHWNFSFGKILSGLCLCIRVYCRISSKKWKYECDLCHNFEKKTNEMYTVWNNTCLLGKQCKQSLSYLIIAFITQSG